MLLGSVKSAIMNQEILARVSTVPVRSFEGVWTKEAASMTVIIIPPWWRTWWAYAIYVLLLSGLIRIYIAYGHARYANKTASSKTR